MHLEAHFGRLGLEWDWVAGCGEAAVQAERDLIVCTRGSWLRAASEHIWSYVRVHVRPGSRYECHLTACRDSDCEWAQRSRMAVKECLASENAWKEGTNLLVRGSVATADNSGW